jgi:NAD+ kinase
VKKIGVLYHPMIKASITKSKELEGFLGERRLLVWRCSAWDREKAEAQLDGTDLLITVGGDGTILRAAQLAIPGGLPITGINTGKLGFMTELAAGEAIERLPSLLGKEARTEERAMLQVEVAAPGRKSRVFHALNDIVIARGEIARVVRIETSVDGEPLTTYRADGVILATATGSTGYALAAGGPILHPQSPDFLLVPVAPHISPSYALVLPESAEVSLRVTAVNPATLSIDGHINLPVSGDDAITVKRSPHRTRFRRIHPANHFYGSLEEKLKGKTK